MRAKTFYGVDAPGVIQNLVLAGILCIILPIFWPKITFGENSLLLSPGLFYSALVFFIPAVLMLLYSFNGKQRHRDHILDKIRWNGSEQVLDVGVGLGLLLIGAAKRLTIGHATGIDIWSKHDLSNNSPKLLLANIQKEGVEEKCTVFSMNARAMSFPEACFDVILSNLCMHNILAPIDRYQTLHEMVRVLKPGGVLVLSDSRYMRHYEYILDQSGLDVHMCAVNWTGTFPPLRILVAKKPHGV